MSSTPTPAEIPLEQTASAPLPEEAPGQPAEPASPAPMTPQVCAQQLKQRFPGLFAGAPKPLKLRIQADIQAAAPGVFTKQVLSAFLRRHTGSTGYLIALTRATHRFDLNGQPVDELSEEHRQAARDELNRRRELTEARRAEEDQQRRNRATLLRDFEKTTLTEANFCALKGVTAEELPGLLALARQEAAEAPPAAAPRGPRLDERRGERGERGEGRGGPGRHEGRPPRQADRGPRPAGSRDERRGPGPGAGGPRPPRGPKVAS